MDVSAIQADMLVRHVKTGKVYRVQGGVYDGAARVHTNEHGTWVTVRAQRDGRDFGRTLCFHPEQLEAAQ